MSERSLENRFKEQLQHVQLSNEQAMAILHHAARAAGKEFAAMLRELNDAGPVLTKTGAKLGRNDRGFYLYGYHASGDDVRQELSMAGLTSPEKPPEKTPEELSVEEDLSERYDEYDDESLPKQQSVSKQLSANVKAYAFPEVHKRDARDFARAASERKRGRSKHPVKPKIAKPADGRETIRGAESDQEIE